MNKKDDEKSIGIETFYLIAVAVVCAWLLSSS